MVGKATEASGYWVVFSIVFSLQTMGCQLPWLTINDRALNATEPPAIYAFAVDPIGSRVFVGDLSGDVSYRVLSGPDPFAQTEFKTPPIQNTDLVSAIELSPTFEVLAIADYYGDLHIHRIENEPRKLRTLKLKHKITDLAFSDDGSRLYVAGASERGIDVINMDDYSLTSITSETTSRSNAICVDNSRGQLVIGYEFVGVKIVSLHNSKVLQHIDTPKMLVYAVALSPQSQFLAIGGSGNQAIIWDCDDGELSSHAEMKGDVRGIEFLDDRHFVAVTHKGWLQIVDVEQGIVVAEVKAHSGWATAVDVSPDSSKITTVGHDGKLHQWRWNPKLPQKIQRVP